MFFNNLEYKLETNWKINLQNKCINKHQITWMMLLEIHNIWDTGKLSKSKMSQFCELWVDLWC